MSISPNSTINTFHVKIKLIFPWVMNNAMFRLLLRQLLLRLRQQLYWAVRVNSNFLKKLLPISISIRNWVKKNAPWSINIDYKLPYPQLLDCLYNHRTKIKFSIKDFFSKCDQLRSFLRIWSHLLKKPFMETRGRVSSYYCSHCSPYLTFQFSAFCEFYIFKSHFT